MLLYICKKFHYNISNSFQLTEQTGVYAYVQRAITKKVGKPELLFMCSACRLIELYICVKFHEISQRISELWSRHE